jgi:hypothetical protein
MPSFKTVAAGICLIGNVVAQTSTFFSPGVPTDAPIPGETTSIAELVAEDFNSS